MKRHKKAEIHMANLDAQVRESQAQVAEAQGKIAELTSRTASRLSGRGAP